MLVGQQFEVAAATLHGVKSGQTQADDGQGGTADEGQNFVFDRRHGVPWGIV